MRKTAEKNPARICIEHRIAPWIYKGLDPSFKLSGYIVSLRLFLFIVVVSISRNVCRSPGLGDSMLLTCQLIVWRQRGLWWYSNYSFFFFYFWPPIWGTFILTIFTVYYIICGLYGRAAAVSPQLLKHLPGSCHKVSEKLPSIQY